MVDFVCILLVFSGIYLIFQMIFTAVFIVGLYRSHLKLTHQQKLWTHSYNHLIIEFYQFTDAPDITLSTWIWLQNYCIIDAWLISFLFESEYNIRMRKVLWRLSSTGNLLQVDDSTGNPEVGNIAFKAILRQCNLQNELAVQVSPSYYQSFACSVAWASLCISSSCNLKIMPDYNKSNSICSMVGAGIFCYSCLCFSYCNGSMFFLQVWWLSYEIIDILISLIHGSAFLSNSRQF